MKTLVGFLLSPLASISRGWALSILWGWFMVPVFHLPTLRIPTALGIATVIGMLTEHVNWQKDDPEYDSMTKVFAGILGPMLCLLFGWIVKLFL